MFRDDVQAARAIRILLSKLGIEALWSDAGPTARAVLLRYENDASLPLEKRMLLLAAWSLWSPAAGGVPLGDVVRTLDSETCRALCSLIVAYTSGAEAVDAWIESAWVPPSPGSEAPPPPAAGNGQPPTQSILEGWPTLDLLSVRYVRRVLALVNGSRSRAASVLGVDRRTVGRWIALSQASEVDTRLVQGRRRPP